MQNCCKRHYNCLPRTIIVEELEPFATALTGKDFVEAWSDTVKRHRVLHRQGIDIDIGDPRLWNILYDPSKRCTVLTDFDLGDIPSFLPSYSDVGRDGAIPFMALNFLMKKYGSDAFPRAYRHELEAFVWVLLFVLWRYNDKTLVEDLGNTRAWFTPRYRDCFIDKWMVAGDPRLLVVQESFKAQLWLGDPFCSGYTRRLKGDVN